jgi:formate hydrogenlyase subunit 4
MQLLAGLLLAPLLVGLVRRTKALLAGRRGDPLVQAYTDLWKLARKGAVYSRSTTWVFRAGPVVGLACALAALALLPMGGFPGLVAFPGDLLLLVGVLALSRLAMILAALDAGSAFGGMGASREAWFGALSEPALLLCLAALARVAHGGSLARIEASLGTGAWAASSGALALASVALFGVLLAENSRIPFDDPATHLELTMVHEAMVLDHGGPDLALIELAAAAKLWVFAGLLAGVIMPVRTGLAVPDGLAQLGGIAAIGLALGVVESTMARLRLLRVPQLLIGIGILAILGVMLAPGPGAAP